MQLPTRILLLLSLSGAAVAARAQALAKSGEAPLQLAPVVVTADLWESPLARIPASVTVYDDAALRTGAVRHFGDLVDQVPNLTWTGGTSRPRYLQIRGVGENSQFEGETPDSAVRFLIDDLDFTGLGTVGTAFDVRQVEVLRGPQAGAFGANAAGGLVRLVSNAPTPYWTGRTETTIGDDGLRSGGLAVGGPLSPAAPETLMMRLAVQQSQSDGFRRNLVLHRDTNARDELTGRLRVDWSPSAEWRWSATLFAADFDNGYDEFALDNNGRFTFSDQPGQDAQKSVAASVRGTYDGWEGLRFSTITSGGRTRSRYGYDDDWTAASYQGYSDLARVRWVASQELRVDSEAGAPLRWTVGAYFAGTEEYSRYRNENPWDLSGLKTRYEAENLALYGQVGRDLTPHARLVLGLRLERFALDGSGTQTHYAKYDGTLDVPVSIAPSFSDTLVGGRIALEHDLGRNALAFASVTRGYKAGGINVDARIDLASDPLTYGTETLWNGEAGVRGHGWGGRLTGEATLFYLARRDAQVRDSGGFGGSYRFFTDNGDGAHAYGLEAAGALALTRAWSLRASLALMRSRLDPFVLANGNAGGGRVLANAPSYGYVIGVRRDAGAGWFGSAELAGRARQYDSNNQEEARRAFRVVNATIGYAWNRWSVALWAKNLLDEVYDRRVYFFGNEDPDYIPARYENRADPRQVGMTAAYRF